MQSLKCRESDIHFELGVPDLKKMKKIYMKPKPDTFVLEEVLRDIKKIVKNPEHKCVYEYTEASMKFKKCKCFMWIFIIITILIAGGWAGYIFALCEHVLGNSETSCKPNDYENNTVNQASWIAFISFLLITLLIIIIGNFQFGTISKTISQRWRTSIKDSIQKNIEQRRKTSPQHIFEINYQTSYRSNTVNGVITIKKKNFASSKSNEEETTQNEHENETKETMIGTIVETTKLKQENKKKGRGGLKVNPVRIEHISVGSSSDYQELSTPITDGTSNRSLGSKSRSNGSKQQQQQLPQMSVAMSNEQLDNIAKENDQMINQLVMGHSSSNLPINMNMSNTYLHQSSSQIGMVPQMNINGSSSNIKLVMPQQQHSNSMRNMQQQQQQQPFQQANMQQMQMGQGSQLQILNTYSNSMYGQHGMHNKNMNSMSMGNLNNNHNMQQPQNNNNNMNMYGGSSSNLIMQQMQNNQSNINLPMNNPMMGQNGNSQSHLSVSNSGNNNGGRQQQQQIQQQMQQQGNQMNIPQNPMQQQMIQQMQMGQGSQSHLSANSGMGQSQHNAFVQNDVSMQQLPPIIPNPPSMSGHENSQNNQYANQYDYGAGDYGQGSQYDNSQQYNDY